MRFSFHRWCAITFVIFAVTLYTGKVVTENFIPKVYTATAEIQFAPAIFDTSGPTIMAIDNPTAQSEMAILDSPNILLPVIQQLGLNKASSAESSKDQPTIAEALAQGLKNLKLANRDGTNVIDITVSNDDPKEAAAIANALADQYKATRDIEEDRRETRGLDSLREQIAEQEKVVEEKKAEFEKQRPEIVGPTSKFDPFIALADRQKDLLAAQKDLDARLVLMNSVANLSDDQFISTLHNLGRDVSAAQLAYAEKSQATNSIAKLLKDGTPETDPRITALREEEGSKSQLVHERVAGVRHSMQIDVNMAKSLVGLLQDEINKLEAKIGNVAVPTQVVHFDQLHRAQALLDALIIRLQQDEADEKLMQSPVRIISRAEAPGYPSSPDKLVCFGVTVLVAALVSLVIGCFVEMILLFIRAAEGEHS